ncbi:MAG: hypothetical protein A2297_00970 [Elusimicrobia bacterium RIFOXYB2_FULL_48_7]|nr:MAG: hypothetical protein A2297_00970 [Elusimicrobia bacterium RIFOXYB2_FULL_48_7]
MSKATILVIDDEKGIRDMLGYTLQQEGYGFISAENGREGLKKALENDIDLVITDIKMPDMEGTEVLEQVKRAKPDVEVIMATGYVTIETSIESLRKGAYDYISKPFNIDEMLMTVGKALEYSRLKKTVIKDGEILGRLRELDTIKTEFLSNVSHELRTPLMSIKNSLDLLADEFNGKLSESGKTLFGVCVRNSVRMGNLVSELMEFSKMESGSFEIKKKKIALKPVVDEVLAEMIPVAGAKKISLLSEFEGGISPGEEINADPDRIKQVLINLTANAVKFTPEGGKITVDVKRLSSPSRGEAPLAGEGGLIEISVTDTGIGISPENLEKVFQKFYQVKAAQSESIKGIGLGLAIAKNIVEAHGGRIWVESGPLPIGPDLSSNGLSGSLPGTKFIFTLPI